MNTTEHVTNKGQGTTKIPNKLIDEKSPYLLQHAYNPVSGTLGEQKLSRLLRKRIHQFS